MTWTDVHCAIPSHLKLLSRYGNEAHIRSLQFKISDKTFDPTLSKSRDFYGLLITCKATESRGFTKLKSKFFIWRGNKSLFFYSYWFAIAKEQRKLELKTILLGVTDTKCPMFNYVLVLDKLHLWNCHRKKSLPFLPSYKELVKKKIWNWMSHCC